MRIFALVIVGLFLYLPSQAIAEPVPRVTKISILNAKNNQHVLTFGRRTIDQIIYVTHAVRDGATLQATTTAHPGNLYVLFKVIDPSRRVNVGRATSFPYRFGDTSRAGGIRLQRGKYTVSAIPFLSQEGTAQRGRRLTFSFSVSFAVARPVPTQTPRPTLAPGEPTPAPTVTPTPEIPIVDRTLPGIDLWEANMLSFGRYHCEALNDSSISLDARLQATYYDAEWIYYQIGDYTKDPFWYECATRAENIYRDQYVDPNNGGVPGYWNFSHGLREDKFHVDDAAARQSVHLLATNGAFMPDTTPLDSTAHTDLSREVAYGIMVYLNDERLGEPHRARTEDFVKQALGHIDQWFVSLTAPYVRPFMFALTAHGLIVYQTQIGGNSEIVPALITGCDWIWDHTWLPGERAFQYTDRVVESGGIEPAPDLNLLIAPIFAWLWNQTGEERFRDRADQIFEGGVTQAFLGNGKQFNQNYRLSFLYVKYRSLPPLQ